MHTVKTILFHILNPLHWFYERQSKVRFVPSGGYYILRGRKYHIHFLDAFGSDGIVGECYRIVKNENGVVTVERLINMPTKQRVLDSAKEDSLI